MRTILVLASMWMLVSMIEASSSLEPVRQKSGRVVKYGGKRLRIRKFRTTTTTEGTTTTTTSTTEAPVTTTTSDPPTTTPNSTEWKDIAENIKNDFKFDSLVGTISSTPTPTPANRAQRGLGFGLPQGFEFADSMGSSSSRDNIIDLGEQDIENLDLTKLYDRDSSKDDPNAPTVLQFIAPSSTSYMDPNYISRIIQQQLGEGYQYTNYTITPSAITSDYTAPFPKDGFKLPPPPNDNMFNNGPPPGFIAQEEHTVRPTKHEFPPVQSTYQSPPPSSSESIRYSGDSAVTPPNGNFGLPVKSSSYSTATRGQSGYKSQNQGFAQVTPTKVYASPVPPKVYTSPSPPPSIYSSPNPSPPIYNAPSPPPPIYSLPIYVSPTPPTYSAPRPPVIYSSPSPTSGFSTAKPPTHYSGPRRGTYSSPTQSTFPAPVPQKDYQVGLSAPGQGYSTLNKGSVIPTANEFMGPPAKGSPASLWTDYSTSGKETNYDLPPVKVSFPDTNAKSPEYKAPAQSAELPVYSTLSEQMVAPGLTPAVTGGYGVSEGQSENIQSDNEAFSNGQGNFNEYGAPADDSGYTVQTDDSGPTTIVRHHHHYVNYVGTGGSGPSGGFDTSESTYRAPKNIFETLGGSNGYSPPADSIGPPSIIYGKPAPQLSYSLPPTSSSFVKFPEASSDDSGSQVSYQSPVGPQENYNIVKMYGPPAPGPSYGPPSPGPSYGPPSPEPSYGPPAPGPSYGPPAPGPSYGPPAPGPSYGPPAPGPSYGPPSEQETTEERPKIFKTIYVNLPPEQTAPKPPPIKHKVPLAPQRHYKIVFIKAPTPPPAPEQEIELPPPPESKTLIYVLHKKPEPPKPIQIVTPKPTEPSAPLVHFIQYKNTKDEGSTGNNIQKPSGDYGLPSTGPSGNNIQKPSGDYGLPSTGPSGPSGSSGEKPFTPGTPLGLSDLGYDVSSSESKVEVQVTKSVSSTK